jgi:hypothetical protein
MAGRCGGSGLGCHSSGRLGLLDPGARRQGVGAHFHAFLVLLRGLGWILPLNQGLLDDPGRLARRDGLAAFERPGTDAASGQQREREPGREEGGQTLDGGGERNR